MGAVFGSSPWFSPDRRRIDRFVLRMLDSRRAELRVCAETAEASMQACVPESGDRVSLRVDSLGIEEPDHVFDARMDDDVIDRLGAGDTPQAWIAVVPLDSLPAQTREVLRIAADLYETDELDLSASEELEQLLLSLRATTWAPEPLPVSLH